MLSLIGKVAKSSPDRIAIAHGVARATYAELAARAEAVLDPWASAAGRRVGLAIGQPIDFVVAAAALDGLAAHAFLAGERGTEELNELAERLGWDYVVDPELSLRPAAAAGASQLPDSQSRVTLLTSGTTGQPKAVNHTWDTLAAPVRVSVDYRDTCWLLTYPPFLYAGLQVLLQALRNGARLAVPESLAPADMARCLREQGVTHASGTPTLWRQLILFGARDELRSCRLRQITLGGEVVHQDVLDQLAELFPDARLAHIYASSELGRVFAVADGKEGFPLSYLHQPPERGVSLRVNEGQLEARSRNAMTGYENQGDGLRDDQFFPTGDLVEIRGERVYFVGRTDDIINVGGRKVSPLQVERVIRRVPGVAQTRVYARSSSLAGKLVAAEITVTPGAVPEDVREAIRQVARDQLRPEEIPRFIDVVDEIAVSIAQKTVRQEKP